MRKVSSECLTVGYLFRYMSATMKTSIIFEQIIFLKSQFILTWNLIRFSASEGGVFARFMSFSQRKNVVK